MDDLPNAVSADLELSAPLDDTDDFEDMLDHVASILETEDDLGDVGIIAFDDLETLPDRATGDLVEPCLVFDDGPHVGATHEVEFRSAAQLNEDAQRITDIQLVFDDPRPPSETEDDSFSVATLDPDGDARPPLPVIPQPRNAHERWFAGVIAKLFRRAH